MGKFLGDLYNSRVSNREIKISKPVEPAKYSQYEIPIGGIFKNSVKAKTSYIAVKAIHNGSCKGCDLLVDGICQKSVRSHCTGYSRSDKTWIIFKKQDDTTK